MGISPIPVLVLVIGTLVFEGLLFGAELVEASFPTYEEPQSTGVFAVFDAIAGVVKVIWGAVVFFFNLITFNVPGAPWYARVLISGILGGTSVWATAQLIRGN